MATTKKSVKAKSKPAARKAAARPRAKAETLKLKSTAPGFTVNDIDKSLAFYRDAVGFTLEERWEEQGKLRGVQLKAGSVDFMLGQDDWKKGRDRKKGEGFRMYCETTQDVDVLAKGIQARGGILDEEPSDQPWGMRTFSLTDPDGFKITIGAPIKKKKR